MFTSKNGGESLKGQNLLQKIFHFYRDGIRSMTLGKTLWKLIFIKLFIIFVVFKIFFFPDIFEKQFRDDAQKIEHVMQILTKN